MRSKRPNLPPASTAKPGMRIPGTSLTTTSETFLRNGKRYIEVRCDCGEERTVYYHNLGKCTKSCGNKCNTLSPEERAIERAARALKGKVPPRKTKKRLSECSPEERAAHLAYVALASNLPELENKARALKGSALPLQYIGPTSCATPAQLAAHWAWLEKTRREYVKPDKIEKGTTYGLWLALESNDKPTSRSKILSRCLLCNETERPVLFRILQSPVNGGCRCTRPPITRPSEVKPGDTLGRWTILEIIPGRKLAAICKCECGNISEPIQLQGLLNGYSQSCGCHNLEVRANRLPAGFRHGRLTVVRWLRQSIRPSGRPGDSVYLCRCDCGNEVEVPSRHLVVGEKSRQRGTLSCKCLRREVNSITGTRMVTEGRIANLRWLYVGKQKARLMRSSWELAVAHKLDSIGLAWDYELESFKLGEGRRYTPDFFLPKKNKWVEVKAISRDKHFFEKVDLFRQQVGRLTVLWEPEVNRLTRLTTREIYVRYAGYEIQDKLLRRKIKTLIADGAGNAAILACVAAAQQIKQPTQP